jgi:peptide/nickel transport system substrate-binding protein
MRMGRTMPLSSYLAPALSVFLAAVLMSCAPAQPRSPEERHESVRQVRHLNMIAPAEPQQLGSKPLEGGSNNGARMNLRIFNAGLAHADENDSYHPELAEALPQLGTDSWRVFPDGQMETTYRLKPGLTWHDGAQLSADDFVFAFEVYAGPELGQSRSDPQNSMSEIVASDPRTVIIRWKRPHPDADTLVGGAGGGGRPIFPPLPRHILDEPLKRGTSEAFLAHPFWSTEYVGLGPFSLVNWERGAFMEARAFDGFVFGRPKIDLIRITFIPSVNTAAASLLAGTADITSDSALDFKTGVVLRQDWETRGAGLVAFFPQGGVRLDVQFDPARVNPSSLLDIRVRQALAHAIDKHELNQAVTEGLGTVSDTWVYPYLEYFPQAQQIVTKYPYDQRVAAQRLADIGYAKGPDGFYTSAAGGRLAMQMQFRDGFEQEAAILQDGLRRFGIDISTQVLPSAQAAADPSLRSTYPALFINGGQTLEAMYGTANLPTAQNRFTGGNRGSWINAEYDRLLDAYSASWDRSQRHGYLVQMARIASEELPAIPLYSQVDVIAHVTGLHGVTPRGTHGRWWNSHLWEFR